MTTMTKIILLIIAFQVVMGILAKRKARQQAEEEARNPTIDPELMETPVVTKKVPIGWSGSEHESTESEDEWDEHNKRDDVRGEHSKGDDLRGEHKLVRDPREEKARRAATGPFGKTGPSGKAGPSGKEKAAELGKDFFSQLAKEFGLELPAPNEQRPRPGQNQIPQHVPHQSPVPVGNPKGVPVTKTVTARPTAQAQKAINQAQRAASDAVRNARISNARQHHESGENSPRRTQSNTPVTQESAPMIAAHSVFARESLFELDSLRRAYILKTILEKPLSLRPRQVGED